jgi:hypothetical protein
MPRPYVALATATSIGKNDFDEPPLLAALARQGIDAQVLAWDDPDHQAGFAGARLCVLRSTWNYVQNHDRFVAWVQWCGQVTALWNPAPIVGWNSHKQYLLELEARGIPIVPTQLVRRGDPAAAAALLDDALARWGTVVTKPAISAGSFGTIRVGAQEHSAGQDHLAAMLRERDMLVQRYEPAVLGHGERSLIWIDGALAHAIRKNPRFSGENEQVSSQAVAIADDERALAERVLAVAPGPLLYARVDLVRDPAGQPQLMELELIEPSLFFDQHLESADRLAAAIARRM